ncbi:MAG: redoxin domain-containing protein [Gaiella sp.]
MQLLRDRSSDLKAAGISALGISVDSPFSHAAWAEKLSLGGTPVLVSDWEREAATACGVLGEYNGLTRANRTIFLVRGDTVLASWKLSSPEPDFDAIIAAAGAAS